jgi:hypothetical protein
VIAHDPVEDRGVGGARGVGTHGAGPSAFRAAPAATAVSARRGAAAGRGAGRVTSSAMDRFAGASREPIAANPS